MNKLNAFKILSGPLILLTVYFLRHSNSNSQNSWNDIQPYLLGSIIFIPVAIFILYMQKK